MLQAIIKKGKVIAEEVPAPILSEGEVLIAVSYSCISAGTELKSVGNSGENLLVRAMKQPENLKKVIDLAKSQGIAKAFSKVQQKVKYGTPTGYSNAGVVIAIGEGVNGLKVGDKVAAAGAGLANHAEYVVVPQNLVMKVPEGLDLQLASTVTLGGIALQGVRRADLRMGEFGVVIGAGILGLLTVQFLKSSGVRTIVSDINEDRLKIAKELGADLVINPSKGDLVKTVLDYTGGHGADGIIFTAATASSDPLSDAFKSCKKKGRVILVGVSGMEIKREDIYQKELDFKISTSYGPGRYDRQYEDLGHDYPYAYVRWTENRNMSEYLRMLQEGKIKLDLLINKIYPIEEAEKAYASLQGPEKPIIVLLSYNSIEGGENKAKVAVNHDFSPKRGILNVALVGAGSFATAMHLPNMEKMKDKYALYAVVNRTGHKGKSVATHFNAKYATSNIDDVLNDEKVDLVFITTQHKDHASLVLRSLRAGKHVFVEKPLATNQEDLDKIVDFYNDGSTDKKPLLLTGFNRRFSKYAQEINEHTKSRINPLYLSYRINAGFKMADDAIHEHGGRVVGEVCHFIDLISYLTGSPLISVNVDKISPNNDQVRADDNVAVILKYQDGSVGNLQYFSIGNKDYQKENLEVHFDGKTIIMDDFKKLTGHGVKVKELLGKVPEKGQFEELLHMYEAITEGKWAITLEDMVQTTRATFLIQND
ncbi:bi-domain-containing oxidoreductase [Allomuricauda taeanensis]|uniref:bi-domain-containing oxidoreductase n=1 Tax=Flagellimonas taeanensis TaxID=1005926 RepID=UPI002E7B028F|nr:bi-domain-containing oxidoreductase [Allomuricauda taeanensis]MEE1961613.1 bi-domain-containing oxidoreductase [Allomuricauda taeanensis]